MTFREMKAMFSCSESPAPIPAAKRPRMMNWTCRLCGFKWSNPILAMGMLSSAPDLPDGEQETICEACADKMAEPRRGPGSRKPKTNAEAY